MGESTSLYAPQWGFCNGKPLVKLEIHDSYKIMSIDKGSFIHYTEPITAPKGAGKETKFMIACEVVAS